MKLIPAAATNGKVLIPLATMLAAGAVAIGSGASFTSTSVHTATVTSGILHHTNDHNGVALAISNLQPGDSQTGSVVIKNDGTLDATAALTATGVNSGFSSALTLKIDEVKADGSKATLYNSDFGSAGTVSNAALGELPVGKSITVIYTVSLSSGAVDIDQNKAAGARFTYVTTQAGGNSTKSFDAITPSPAPATVTPTVNP